MKRIFFYEYQVFLNEAYLSKKENQRDFNKFGSLTEDIFFRTMDL